MLHPSILLARRDRALMPHARTCREITDDASDGPVLEGADTPERLLERLGFPRPRQQQLVSLALCAHCMLATRPHSMQLHSDLYRLHRSWQMLSRVSLFQHDLSMLPSPLTGVHGCR